MNQEKKITLITGAGSLENAWNPINRALGFEIGNTESANAYLSGIVHELRLYSRLSGPSQEDKHIKPTFEKIQKRLLKKYNEVKFKIVKELDTSLVNGELYLRPIFEKMINIFCEEEPHVITTNWDHVIQDFVTKTWSKNNWVNFIHGTTSEIYTFTPNGRAPHSLLLPGETSFEPYFTEPTKNHLTSAIFLANGVLKGTKKLILYGISLSPLDAELNVTLSNFLNHPSMEVVVVVNPSYKIVIQRLKAIKLIQKNKNRIIALGVDPTGVLEQEKINI